MKEDILEFINRRFKNDCDWTSGNCYYFALILKNRFSMGDIYYDVIDGHFIFKYENNYFDWTGIVNPKLPIEWRNFDYYDKLQADRIIRDCLL